MGRKQKDVFVLGQESLLDEPATTVFSPPLADEDRREPEGEASSPAPVRMPRHARGPRRIALLGLGAVAAATLAALKVSGAGPAQQRRDRTQPRTALALSPPARAAAPSIRAAPAHLLADKPHPRTRHLDLVRGPRNFHDREPEREPSAEEAPASSPVEAPAPAQLGSPVPAPSPPSPAPPSGGGGSVREEFGFER